MSISEELVIQSVENLHLHHFQTGIFYDARCLLHQANYNHYEGPRRLLRSFERLVDEGIWDHCQHLNIEGQKYDDLSTIVRLHRESRSALSPEDDNTLKEERTEEEKKANEKVFTDYLSPSISHPLLLNNIYDTPLTIHDVLNDILPIVEKPQDNRTPNLSQRIFQSQTGDRVKNPIPLLVHSPSYIASIETTMHSNFGPDEEDSETEGDDTLYPDSKFVDDDSYINEFSWLATETATIGMVGLTRALLEGKIKNAFALIRPPGHHAGLQSSGGFCLYNNIALAAETALRHPNKSIRKVLIVDYDVHHGNGTQDIFYQRDDVLFFSIHRYSPPTFYPSSGAMEEVGEKKGRGYTVNFPISTETTDSEFLSVFETIFLPIAREFSPDLLFISAGFDILQGDPVGEMQISPDSIETVTRSLVRLMDGKNVIAALEGGYDPEVVADGVVRVVKCLQEGALNGEKDQETSVIQETQETQGKKVHKKQSPFVSSADKAAAAEIQKRELLFRAELKKLASLHMNHWRCMFNYIKKK